MNESYNTFSKIIASILCVILFCVELTTFSIFAMGKFMTTKSIKESLKDVKVTDLLNQTEENISYNIQKQAGNGSSPMNDIYQQAQNYGISSEDVDKIINSDTTKDLISEYLGSNAEFIMNGSEPLPLTGSEITKIFKENIDTISKEANINLTESQTENMISVLEKNADKLATTLPSSKQLTEKIDQNQLKTIRFMFSTTFKIILIVGAIILAGLIALLRKSWYRWAMWTGITTLIASISTMLGSLIVTPLFNLIQDYIPSYLANLISGFIDVLGKQLLLVGFIGITLAIIQIIFSKIMTTKLESVEDK